MKLRKTTIFLVILLLVTIIFGINNIKTTHANNNIVENIIGMNPIYKELENYTVSIVSINPGLSICSGVVIGKDENYTYVLTCKHCLSLLEEYYVDHNKVKYIIATPEDDLLYLIVDGVLDKKVAVLAEMRTSLEENIYHVAYPSLHKNYTSNGKIIRYSEDWGFANLKVKHGCSGGGIFNRARELVGIVWGFYSKDNITIFEDIEDVKIFLEEVREIVK